MSDETQKKIAALKKELSGIDSKHAAQAQSAAGFAAAAAHEATRTPRSGKLLQAALLGLEHSAEEFEATHPRVAAAISELIRELASLGI